MTALVFVPALMFLAGRMLLVRRVRLGHVEAFTLGFLVYCAVPMTLATIDLAFDSVPAQLWQRIVTMGGIARLEMLMWWSMGLWSCFVAGSALASLADRPAAVPSVPTEARGARVWTLLVVLVSTALLAFGLAWAVTNRGMLFAGYSGAYEELALGPLQTAILAMTLVTLMAASLGRSIGRAPLLLAGAVLALLSALSLSVGTRQAVTVTLVALVAFASVRRGGVRRELLLVIASLAITGFAIVSAWRIGDLSLQSMLLTPAFEPMFTFLSLATFLAFETPAPLAVPTPLLLAFLNLVPSAVWPEKIEVLDAMLDQYAIVSPLGATHLIVSSFINFGWLGSLLVALASGFAIERLRQLAKGWVLFTPTYALVVGVLASDLWRNPFQNAVVKSLFQAGVLVPLALVLVAAGVTALVRMRSPVIVGRRLPGAS